MTMWVENMCEPANLHHERRPYMRGSINLQRRVCYSRTWVADVLQIPQVVEQRSFGEESYRGWVVRKDDGSNHASSQYCGIAVKLNATTMVPRIPRGDESSMISPSLVVLRLTIPLLHTPRIAATWFTHHGPKQPTTSRIPTPTLCLAWL